MLILYCTLGRDGWRNEVQNTALKGIKRALIKQSQSESVHVEGGYGWPQESTSVWGSVDVSL